MSWNQGRLYHINEKEPMLQVWQMEIYTNQNRAWGI